MIRTGGRSVPECIHTGRGNYNMEPPMEFSSLASDAKQMDKIRLCGIKADLEGAMKLMRENHVSLSNAMLAYSAGRRYAKGGK